jgi:hypothetical protein
MLKRECFINYELAQSAMLGGEAMQRWWWWWEPVVRLRAPGINDLLTVVKLDVSELKSSPATSQAVETCTVRFKLH